MTSSVSAYLTMENCSAAIEFYKTVFGAEENSARILDDQNRIGHASIKIGESLIHLNDEHPEIKVLGPKSIGNSPVNLLLSVDDVDAVFKLALEQGATELIPVANQFYGHRSGRLEDPSGHVWIISTTIEDVPDNELEERSGGEYHVAKPKS